MSEMKKRKRRNNEKKMIKLVWRLLAALVCVLVVAVLFINARKNQENEQGDKNDTVVENNEDDNEWIYKEAGDGFDVSTSYGNLVFPEKWKEYIKIEVVKTDECETVQFWFELEGKEKVHVFDILFGGEGYLVGVIRLSDSEEIYVNVESYGYVLDDTWTDEEKEILSGIENDINYLLENLTSLENYTPIN